MDIADDIAYATYDLEDALKAEFVTPTKIVSIITSNSRIRKEILRSVNEKIAREFCLKDRKFIEEQDVVLELYSLIFNKSDDGERYSDLLFSAEEDDQLTRGEILSLIIGSINRKSELIASDAYYRTTLTSSIIRNFVQSVQVDVCGEFPPTSRAYLPIETFTQIEILKNFTFNYLTMSPMLRVKEYRGYDIVTEIFNALTSEKGHMLLPNDFRDLYENITSGAEKQRVICDFISGMTDRYATNFYSKLKGDSFDSIWSPL